MPHKKNPILSENLTGLARIVRSHVAPALENIALWHEREIFLIQVLKKHWTRLKYNIRFCISKIV